MPRHRRLVTFKHMICHTRVIAIDHKTVGLEVFPQFLVENQCTLQQKIQGLVHLHIQHGITLAFYKSHTSGIASDLP